MNILYTLLKPLLTVKSFTSYLLVSIKVSHQKKRYRNHDFDIKFVDVQPFQRNIVQVVWFSCLPFSVLGKPVIIRLPSVITKSSLGSAAGLTRPVISNGGLCLG